MDENDQNDNLPIPAIDTQIKVTANSTPEQVIAEDVAIANEVLEGLCSGWNQVKSISGLCKMASTTMSVLEARRKLLLMPYGAKGEGSTPRTVLPID